MNRNHFKHFPRIGIIGIFLLVGMMPLVFADVYVNVMAVNGSPTHKNTSVKFDLPGELTAADILDTSGLQVDYDVNNANYFVHGDVSLDPKESKTFKVRVRDVWKITPDQTADIKKQIDEGFQQLGKVHDPQKAEVLKTELNSKLDYILNEQNTKADSIEGRIDSYRSYAKELKRIENDALSVDYWRSEPGAQDNKKVIHMTVEIENPPPNPAKTVKEKEYLPSEVRPEHVVEAEGFEVRFDQVKQLAFLFKEEPMGAGEKKHYSIGILDIWFIPQPDIDYLRKRADYANGYLKTSKYAASAQFLMDRITTHLKDIETSQAQTLPILEHISSYRTNKRTFDDTERDVEELEKLLSVYREDLEKSKVENVLRKIKGLKSVDDVSKAIFNKQFTSSTAWNFIAIVLGFVGLITFINFIMWMLRSKDKKIKEDESSDAPEAKKK